MVLYKQYIDENSSDQRRLFRASKRPLNFHVGRALPPHTDPRMLANEMGEYFVHKITAIRSELDAGASGATSLATSASTCSEFSEFSPLSDESVRRIAASCAKSCALDPLPSSIMTFCLDELLPVVRKIVNLSLESGVFAEDWKNASVHPLLKKAGLKPINKKLSTGEQLAGSIKDYGKVRGYPITISHDSQQLISCSPKRISAESQH